MDTSWIHSVEDKKLLSSLLEAETSWQVGDIREALLLLAGAEQRLLCQQNPDPQICKHLAELRIWAAALETNKEGQQSYL